MGRYALMVVLAVAAATGVAVLQGAETSLRSAENRSDHQKRVVARQIAWSGFNAILAEARYVDRRGKKVSEIVATVKRRQVEMEGGRYDAWLEETDQGNAGGRATYYVMSEGTFQGTTVRLKRLRQSVTRGNGNGNGRGNGRGRGRGNGNGNGNGRP